MSPSDIVVKLILNTDGVIAFDAKNHIEVRPARKSPIHINFKNTLPHSKVRETIAGLLAEQMKADNINYVCGLESGGSYFASRCSDNLAVPLSLYRKYEKQYAEKGLLAGSPPEKGSHVAIIDDTLVSGKTIQPVVEYMKQYTDHVYVYVILSYGLDSQIQKWLGVKKITSISQVPELIQAGRDEEYFSHDDEREINLFINNQRNDREKLCI